MSALKIMLVTAAAAYGAIVVLMFLFQRNLQYHPENKGLTPESVGLSGVEDMTIATPDGERIRAWHLPAPEGRPTILFFQGNAGEIGDRPARMQLLRRQWIRRTLRVLSRLWRQQRHDERGWPGLGRCRGLRLADGAGCQRRSHSRGGRVAWNRSRRPARRTAARCRAGAGSALYRDGRCRRRDLLVASGAPADEGPFPVTRPHQECASAGPDRAWRC